MQFWWRYTILILACIVLPLGMAFYVDTQGELSRSETAGARAANVAPQTLVAYLKLEGHRMTGKALTLAQKITDERLLDDFSKPARVSAAFRSVVAILDTGLEDGGFAWAVDEHGAVIAQSGQTKMAEKPEHITGLPLYVATQQGYALDGLWRDGQKLYFVGAVPLVRGGGGTAMGAVFVGRPIDMTFLKSLAQQIRHTALTLVVSDRMVASTLPQDVANSIVADVGASTEPVLGGRRSTPLESGVLMTPMFVGADAEGIAYTSVSAAAPGSPDVRWILSVDSADTLDELAGRQDSLLAVLLAALLLAVVIGLVLQRTFVKPIDTLVDHLAEIHAGRAMAPAEREMQEFRVSGPFRRLVKLVNMTVQKVPSSSTAGGASYAEIPAVPSTVVGIDEIPGPNAESVVGPATGILSPAGGVSVGTPSPPPGADGLGIPAAAVVGATPAPGMDHGMSVLPLPEASATPFPGVATAEGGLAGMPVAGPPTGVSGGGMPGAGNGMPAAGGIPVPGGGMPMAAGGMPAAASGGMPTPAGMPAAGPGMPMAGGGIPVPGGGMVAAGGMPVAGGPPPVPGGMPAAGGFGIGGDTDLADALPPAPKSAADIRGRPVSQLDAAEPEDTEADLEAPAMVPMGPGMPGVAAAADAAPQFGAAEPPPPPVADLPQARMGGSAAMTSDALGAAGLAEEDEDEDDEFPGESTVVARVADELIAKTRDKTTNAHDIEEESKADRTVVTSVPQDILEQERAAASVPPSATTVPGADLAEHADQVHFRETYDSFIELRSDCGEPTADLSYERFVAKLKKNRDGLVRKYNCRTVRFQVYKKDGKAALKATPIRGDG